MLLRWRAGLGLVVGLGWMTLSSAVGSAPSVYDPNALRLTVVDAVLGILAHTRWPQRSPRPLSLCVNERSSAATDLHALQNSVPPGKLVPVRMIDLADALPLECDAVWLGADFCSRGGMFCLVPRQSDRRVAINLDAVARSGLHVHPQVLKIGQPRPGGATP